MFLLLYLVCKCMPWCGVWYGCHPSCAMIKGVTSKNFKVDFLGGLNDCSKDSNCMLCPVIT